MWDRVAVIVGAALVIGGIVNGGVYAVAPSGGASTLNGGTVYVINRYTGNASICTATFCRELREATPSGQ